MTQSASTQASSPPVLGGLRVVEYPAYIAAPLAGLTLAQLGADVIRVDPPGGNIDIGRWPLGRDGKSLYWASLNRGKRSVEIDLRRPEGTQLLAELVAATGPRGRIFVTNLNVDGELTYEHLSSAIPDLIMVQLSGSPDGQAALDYTVNSAVGFPSMTGDGSAGPVNHVLPAWDVVAGLTIAVGILAADRRRQETGRGELIRLALSDVAMATSSNLGYIAEAQLTDHKRGPDGNSVYGAYGDSFATADGRYVMVVAISNRQWRALVDAVGVTAALDAAAVAAGYELKTEGGRYAARELISAFLRPWLAQRTLAEITGLFADKGVLWSPYRTVRQMVEEDPRCSEINPMFESIEHPVGTFLTATSPMSFRDAARTPPGVAPQLGQHTAEVLQELLSMGDAELHKLADDGLIGKQAAR